MGESDFKHGRTLLGWAADVAELADHLGQWRFGVAGASGGGPYVLAVAHALAERLQFAADLADAGPVDEAGRTASSTVPSARYSGWPTMRRYWRGWPS